MHPVVALVLMVLEQFGPAVVKAVTEAIRGVAPHLLRDDPGVPEAESAEADAEARVKGSDR